MQAHARIARRDVNSKPHKEEHVKQKGVFGRNRTDDHIFNLPDSNPGVRFDQAYNMQTLKPIPEWQKMYEEVKREISAMSFYKRSKNYNVS